MYDVQEAYDGSGYEVQVSMEPDGLFFTRDIILKNLGSEVTALNVHQKVTFSGTVTDSGFFINMVCNALELNNVTISW